MKTTCKHFSGYTQLCRPKCDDERPMPHCIEMSGLVKGKLNYRHPLTSEFSMLIVYMFCSKHMYFEVCEYSKQSPRWCCNGMPQQVITQKGIHCHQNNMDATQNESNNIAEWRSWHDDRLLDYNAMTQPHTEYNIAMTVVNVPHEKVSAFHHGQWYEFLSWIEIFDTYSLS